MASAPNERLRFDIETDGYNELVITKKGDVTKEAKVVHCMWIQDLYDRSCTLYKGDDLVEGVKRLWAAKIIGGHNIIAFDIPVLERITGLAKPDECKPDDSLIRSRVLWPEHGSSPLPGGGMDLAAWGQALGCPKGDFQGPWNVWSLEMETYCFQDVLVHERIEEKLAAIPQNELVVRIEQTVSRIIAMQTANGWGFDLDGCDKLIHQLELERAGIMDELAKAFPDKVVRERMKTPDHYLLEGSHGNPIGKYPTKSAAEKEAKAKAKTSNLKPWADYFTITPGPMKVKETIIPFNPDSGQQIVERFKERYGWEPTEFTVNKGTKETTTTPKTDADVLSKLPYPEAKIILRAADNSKMLEALKDYSTRASNSRDGNIHGTINVQGAVTGRMTHNQPNTGNVYSTDAENNFDPRVRKLWRPTRKGWKVVGGDAQGLELRMLANRMAKYDGGAYGKILLESDIHDANAEILKLAVPTIVRKNAKTFIYGFIYGAGDAKAGKIVGKGSDVGKKMKNVFLQKLPALGRCIDDAKREAKTTGYVVLLDTRKVPCRHAYAALNTQLQGDGAVVMKVALMCFVDAMKKRGWKWGADWALMGNIHDEFQVECRPEIAEEVGKLIAWSIGEAGRRLKCKIQLDGSYKVGDTWAGTH